MRLTVTQSSLQVHLEHIQKIAASNLIYFKSQEFCLTLKGNICKLLTITNYPNNGRHSDERYIPIGKFIKFM